MADAIKLEIPRFIFAGLAATEPVAFAGKRWFVGERAGERYAVNFIPTQAQRRVLLVCLRKDAGAITAAELADMFGQTTPMKRFIQTIKELSRWKIATVEGGSRGKPFRIFSGKFPRRSYGRVEWEFTKDYLTLYEQTPRQVINYPLEGVRVNLNKYPMVPMLMLAFSEWYSMNRTKPNAWKIPIRNALKYCPVELKQGNQWHRDVKEPLDNALSLFGLRKTAQGWGEFSKQQIDLQRIFPKKKTKKRRRR